MKDSFRAIRVKSREEFESLIEHVTTEAFRVRGHWEFWAALDESLEQYVVELNQTPRFWELTREAHMDAVILRLSLLFDPHPTAISLSNLLRTMREHAVGPSTPLPPVVANLDLSELDQEMSNVWDCDETVKKLLTSRNEYLVHRGSRHVASGTFASLPSGTRPDCDAVEPRVGLASKVQKSSWIPAVSLGATRSAGFQSALSAPAGGATGA